MKTGGGKRFSRPLNPANHHFSMKELCVSKASLAPDGPAPEVGDPVTLEVAGTVSRVEGDRYYISADTANGEPIPASEDMESGEPDGDDLRAMAQKSDEEAGYP